MHTITSDLRPHHRIAVQRSIDIVHTVSTAGTGDIVGTADTGDIVGTADLDRPTPCAGWTLADLLAHMTVQHRGFAAAARGNGADDAIWQAETVAEAVRTDPAGTYASAARDVLDAFAADGIADATFALPEFGPGATFPGTLAIGFHFVDYVVHGWDVAATLGAPYELPADVIAAVLPLVMAIPDGDFRATGSAPFARAVNTSATTDFEQILAHLGRRPDWRQP